MNRWPAKASKRAMHPETYKMLKRHCDGLRAQMSDALPSSTALASLLNVAEADRLIAAYDAASEPLPSRWAHVHEVDGAGVTGIVTSIPGGIRVEWLDADVSDDATEPTARLRDIYEISRIDWISADEYRANADMTRSMVADRIKQRLRNSTMPDGFVIVQRVNEGAAVRFGVQRADGLVYGYWNNTNLPREAAWDAFDGDTGLSWKPPIDPVEPYTGDLNIPF